MKQKQAQMKEKWDDIKKKKIENLEIENLVIEMKI